LDRNADLSCSPTERHGYGRVPFSISGCRKNVQWTVNATVLRGSPTGDVGERSAGVSPANAKRPSARSCGLRLAEWTSLVQDVIGLARSQDTPSGLCFRFEPHCQFAGFDRWDLAQVPTLSPYERLGALACSTSGGSNSGESGDPQAAIWVAGYRSARNNDVRGASPAPAGLFKRRYWLSASFPFPINTRAESQRSTSRCWTHQTTPITFFSILTAVSSSGILVLASAK
jgi:hypothetical protein